ncbi:hypothetical protein [Sphingomonas sp. 10B4]|nr:hypothetical protein [Sphingomonas sp. 10B4]MDY7523288.1 hypothetical protein [Sphingomonas sp. 10B4]MEB0283888.1 hypothetical protein [Sphingomonas sp. 10B4]
MQLIDRAIHQHGWQISRDLLLGVGWFVAAVVLMIWATERWGRPPAGQNKSFTSVEGM